MSRRPAGVYPWIPAFAGMTKGAGMARSGIFTNLDTLLLAGGGFIQVK